MANITTSAIAAWLGYKSQEYRLVQRLLESNNNATLGFEMLDDVEEHIGDKLVLEQDKVSITKRNIVSNQSKDLWKTLSNWVDLISNNVVDPSKTTFLLYTNREHSSEVLTLLVNANSDTEAQYAYKSILNYVSEPSENIKKYVSNFREMGERVFTLISNFTYTYGSGMESEDLKVSYQNRLGCIDEHTEEILHEILGWTADALKRNAEQRLPTLISAKSFGNRLAEIESKYRQQKILRFLCSRSSSSDDVLKELDEEPTYIQQLRLVDIDSVEIVEAAIAKLETKDAICKWTIDGHIQETCFSKYQSSLKRKWTIKKNKALLDEGSISNKKIGAHLYYECLESTEDIKLNEKIVDEFFPQGALQNLSDDLTIGWHPEYETLLGSDNENT